METTPIKEIKCEDAYLAALARIGQFLDAEPGTREFDTLEEISILIDEYEKQAYPMPKPDPGELINYLAEQGLPLNPLAPESGRSNRVSFVRQGTQGRISSGNTDTFF